MSKSRARVCSVGLQEKLDFIYMNCSSVLLVAEIEGIQNWGQGTYLQLHKLSFKGEQNNLVDFYYLACWKLLFLRSL